MANKINLKLKGAVISKFGTQRAFADELEVDESFVSDVLRGRKKLGTDKSKEWADVLDLEELPDAEELPA